MNKAKQVVETWARQFHSAPREQRLVFLYLANDILQNSRRKGPDFVGEFWKVLPEALRDVIHNGDDSGRRSAMRLVSKFYFLSAILTNYLRLSHTFLIILCYENKKNLFERLKRLKLCMCIYDYVSEAFKKKYGC